ncbi:unnamed protein product [Camellia sinensis]
MEEMNSVQEQTNQNKKKKIREGMNLWKQHGDEFGPGANVNRSVLC